MSANQFLVEQLSPFDVETTVGKIVQVATDMGWQNPATHNLQQSLAKSGKEVRPVQVVEICKPEFSGKMLEGSDERIVSIMMPCRISIYEKEDGKTYIALLDPKDMASGMSEKVKSAMTAASDETFRIVNQVVGK